MVRVRGWTYSFAKTPLNAAQAPLATAYTIHCVRVDAGVWGPETMVGAGWAAALDFLPRRWRTMIFGSWRVWDEMSAGSGRTAFVCKLVGDGVAWTLRGAKSGTHGTGRLHVLWRTWREVSTWGPVV